MVGAAVRRAAAARRDLEIVAPPRAALDLLDAAAVRDAMRALRPDCVLHLAARVGGIHANIADPVGFYRDNVLINTHVVDAALAAGVERLLNLGSSCMYPADVAGALREDMLLTAPLEPTNEGYALAKIGAARHCAYVAQSLGFAYRTVIPCNLYGPGDAFDPARSHLVAAAVKKVVDARAAGAEAVTVWGDGQARREFLHVDDLAAFLVGVLGREETLPDMVNVGYGEDFTVDDYHRMAADAADWRGRLDHDLSRPVGMRRKLMDVSRARALGWRPRVAPRDGIAQTVAHYSAQAAA
jgi:GDP-L-fucose synthase